METGAIFGLIFIAYALGILTMITVELLDHKKYYKRTKQNIEDLLSEIDRLQNKLIERNARTFYLKLK